jgi:hypothetical protein
MADDSSVRFSVTIPTFNYARYLPYAIDSILAQKTDRDEIIVIDDASTDHTARIAGQYGEEIVYLRLNENVGPGRAWAEGISRAQGRYLCKLDADDWHLPGSLDRFEEAFEAHPSAGMIAAAVYEVHDESARVLSAPVDSPVGLLHPSVFRRRLLRTFFFHMPGISLRQSALQGSLPRTDLWMPHDWEYLIRTMQGWSCFVIKEPIAVYRMHDTSVTRTADRATRLQSDLLRLSDLALDTDSELHLTGSEARAFHTALGEIYLRLAPFLRMSRVQRSSRLKFAWILHFRVPGNKYLSLIAMVSRVLRAKVSSLLLWRLRVSTRDVAELAPTPYSTTSVDDGPTLPNG